MTAGNVKKVWLLARRGSLEATISYYLVERIKAQPNIEVLTRSEVTALEGCGQSSKTARWRHCGRPKAAAFSTSARWSAVGTYSAGISRSVSLNSRTRAREAGNCENFAMSVESVRMGRGDGWFRRRRFSTAAGAQRRPRRTEPRGDRDVGGGLIFAHKMWTFRSVHPLNPAILL
jgi:hypothetical protein